MDYTEARTARDPPKHFTIIYIDDCLVVTASGAQSTNEMVAAAGRWLAASSPRFEPGYGRAGWLLAGLLAWLGSRACSLRPVVAAAVV
eukprot:COSAG01_NODE_4051_length_5393_cov_16.152626_1_plen_87_part_10